MMSRCIGASLASIALHPSLFIMAVGYAVATTLSLNYPEHNLFFVGGGNFVFMLNLLWMGRPVLIEDREKRRVARRSSLPPR
mgnify:CR=1 FL=1